MFKSGPLSVAPGRPAFHHAVIHCSLGLPSIAEKPGSATLWLGAFGQNHLIFWASFLIQKNRNNISAHKGLRKIKWDNIWKALYAVPDML